ncbi:GumC family protein [Tsuneonella mangrovi]|uniref:GumC family protein n=1 Tax=Tsuneonella mangrovi TaxID=1982042 RepID=UPI000BA1FF2B|nr:polysaccharide biosynthesis tyrosine autokinase [Tsuneonella mangrovi]
MNDSPHPEPSNSASQTGWLEELLRIEPDGGYGPFNMLDISKVRGFLWRQRYVLGGIVAGFLVLGFLITMLMTPIFQATSTVRVDPEMSTIVDDGQAPPDLRGNDYLRYISTLTTVIQSRSLALRVVDALDLGKNAEFVGSDAARLPPAKARDIAATMLMGEVKAETPDDNRIIQIHVRSPDPALAAKIANAYSDAFLEDDIRRSLAKNEYAQTYLSKQIGDVRKQLQDAERKAISYARTNRIVGDALLGQSYDPATGTTSDQAAPPTTTASNLAAINAAYSAAVARRIQAQQRWDAIARTDPADLPEVQQSVAVQQLITNRAAAASQLADLQIRYGKKYPQVSELQAQIATIDRQITQVSNDIKDGIHQNYLIAQRQESALAGQLHKVSNETLNEQDRRVVFNQLQREAFSLRAQLQDLMARYNQISSAANARPGTITKLDAATVPGSPSSPNVVRNMLLALIAGVSVAVMLALLRDAFDDRLHTLDDVERKLALPPLGFTPFVADMEDEKDSVAQKEAYTAIRTSIDFALPRRGCNVIQVTSSQVGEGKTTVAEAIARKFAQMGRKVLLVDADLRKPSIAAQFGQARGKLGLPELLLGQCSLEDVLVEHDQPDLDVVPVGPLPANPTDILSSQQFADFIDQQRANYALIVLDSPPVIGLADSPVIAQLTDGLVFIIEANRAHFGQAKAAVRRLRQANANILGVVMTKFRPLDAGQAYDYQYNYYSYGKQADA